MSDKLARLLATFFYIGYFPMAPGSFASIAGMSLFFIFGQNVFIYIIIFIILTRIGFEASGRLEELLKQKDPSCIVIDEVCGVMIAFFMLPNISSVMWVTFFLFRAFDMFKIYPINKLENMEGGVGVMMDDIVAGIYTNITMQIAIRLAGLV